MRGSWGQWLGLLAEKGDSERKLGAVAGFVS